MSSEVARIKAEIEQEIRAMHRVFREFAHVGRHDSITAQNENLLNEAVRKLAPLVGGEEEAMQELCAIYVDADMPRMESPCPHVLNQRNDRADDMMT